MNILEARRRLLEGGVKKRTAEGNPIVVWSLARMYPGLNIYGWSKQDGTPSPENPVPIVSAGDEGEISVTVQGGNLADIPDIYAGDDELNETIQVNIYKTFTVSVDEIDLILVNKVWRLKFDFEDGNSQYAIDGYFPITFKATQENKVVRITYRNIRMESGSYRNFMLNYGSTVLPYMPYKTPQILTAQTPGGLPGIPVSSGGNYTDESGQAWVCDEVDFKRGKYVQRVWRKTFDGTENWSKYGIEGATSNYGFMLSNALPEPMNCRNGFCNQYKVITSSVNIGTDIWFRFGSGANNPIAYVLHAEQYDPSLEDSGLANWKAHLAQTPLEVMTYLTTPIETDLPAEEIAAYKALHTYSPATTVSNDAKAWMKVGYKTRKSLEVTT